MQNMVGSSYTYVFIGFSANQAVLQGFQLIDE
jgi:hypothetical protein